MPRQPTKAQLIEKLDDEGKVVDTLIERIGELEMVIQDRDFEWQQLSGEGVMEFSRDALAGIIRTARLMYLKNPLIQRAVRVQAHYVFGQGFSVKAQDEEVDVLVQKFMEDPANTRVMTDQQSAVMVDEELTVTGNLFVALFTDPSTGRVVLRLIPVEEIPEIICNPEDAQEVWYYRRQHTGGTVNTSTGSQTIEPKTTYYPDWQYTPTPLPTSFNGQEIAWGSPVYHVKVGGFNQMRFGVPEVYAALDWARSVTRDLEDYASLRRSLSRWAWRVTSGGGARGVAALKSRFNTTIGDGSNDGESNPPPTSGSMFLSTPNTSLEPIRTAGAAPHPDEGRRLWLMVSAGTGIPETILAGDADVGNLATAKTLDRPTELQMTDRMQLWKTVYEDLTSYLIEKGITSPKGLLKGQGRMVPDPYTGDQMVELTGTTEGGGERSTHVDVEFPSVLERDMVARVTAIVSAVNASTTPVMTHETLVRLILTALGVDDIAGEWEKLQPVIDEAEQRRAQMASLFGQGGNDDDQGDEEGDDGGDSEDEGEGETDEQREARVLTTVIHFDEILRRFNKPLKPELVTADGRNGHVYVSE